MLIKWVACRTGTPEAFDSGQRTWAGLRGLAGFLGQIGGWSRDHPGLAHLIGCWVDRPHYETFLAGQHDTLAAGQAGTYDQIDVRLFMRQLPIGDRFPAIAGVLRLAHCQVRPERRDHFVAAQAGVWNPGMSRAPGMRGGVFAHREGTEFLVLSLWETAADHERYRTERFPGLRQRAGADDDLDRITGDLVDLVPEWTVLPAD